MFSSESYPLFAVCFRISKECYDGANRNHSYVDHINNFYGDSKRHSSLYYWYIKHEARLDAKIHVQLRLAQTYERKLRPEVVRIRTDRFIKQNGN